MGGAQVALAASCKKMLMKAATVVQVLQDLLQVFIVLSQL